MADVQMKGITCCADCVYYSMKKHKCIRGYKEEGKATDHFYKDCPLPDVRPVVRGAWIGIDDFPYEDWECSVCGEQVCGNDRIPRDMHFCPSCGADMREVQDGA